jgi:hypothetical protein
LLGKLTSHAFGDFFKVPPEVTVQCFFGLGLSHFVTSDFRKLGRAEPNNNALFTYEQRFSLLPASNPSPEGIDESVLEESPLVDKHTGPGEVRHSSCVTPMPILVV